MKRQKDNYSDSSKDEFIEIPNFGSVAELYRSYLWVAVGLGALAVALFLAAIFAFPEKYTATARLVVEPSEKRVMDTEEVLDESIDSLMVDQVMYTHVEQMQGNEFLNFAWDWVDPNFRERAIDPYRREGYEKTNDLTILKDWMRVERNGFSLLIDINITHRDPEIAKILADTLTRRYVDFTVVYKNEWNDSAVSFLEDQAAQLRKSLEVAEMELQSYRQQTNLVSLEGNQDVLSERLKLVSESHTRAKLRRLELENTVKQIDVAEKDGPSALLTLQSIYQVPNVRTLSDQRDELRSRLSMLSETYHRNHPRIREVNEAIATNEAQLIEEIGQAVLRLRNEYEVALDFENRLTKEMEELERETLQLAETAVEYNIMKRRAEVKQNAYNQVLNRLLVTEVTSKTGTTNVRALDKAILPEDPSFPTPALATLGSIAIFFLVASATPPVCNLATRRLKYWDDLESIFDVKIIGMLPKVGKLTNSRLLAKLPGFGGPEGEALRIEDSDDTVAKECLRSLHSRLHLSSISKGNKVFLLTSTGANEGKSTLAYNLGQSMANSGKKTVLIDCDFRRPFLDIAFAQEFGFGPEYPDTVGLVDWFNSVREEDDLSGLTINASSAVPDLSLISAGSPTKYGARLILSEKFKSLVASLRAKYDVVIIDSPPAGVFSDTLLLTTVCDEVLFLVKYGAVRMKELRGTVELIHSGQADIAGFVLNSLSKKQIQFSNGMDYEEEFRLSAMSQTELKV